MILLQYRSAGLNRSDDTVGDMSGPDIRKKVLHYFLPGVVRDQRMDAAVGDTAITST
jgi:hypothetical protein